MKIFIAAGHGGADPGSSGSGATERDEAIKVVNKCAALLAPIMFPPRELIIVPHELALEKGVKYINDRTSAGSNDFCIEVHFNNNQGTPGTGTETFYGYKKLAQTLQKNLVATLKLADRGVKIGNDLYFNATTTPGSALVEMGFINNAGDLLRVQQVGALALARGVAEYIGLQLPTPPPPLPPQTDWQAKYTAAQKQITFLKVEIGKILQQV